ncbi:MAG: hypothetical protein ACJ72A_22980 [Nocardioidaceae bacterium]
MALAAVALIGFAAVTRDAVSLALLIPRGRDDGAGLRFAVRRAADDLRIRSHRRDPGRALSAARRIQPPPDGRRNDERRPGRTVVVS